MQSRSGASLGHGYFKFMGFIFFPVLIILITAFALLNGEYKLFLCNGLLLPVAALHLFLAIMIVPSKENAESNEKAFLEAISNLGYEQDTDSTFDVVMVGHCQVDPVAVRINRANYVIVQVRLADIPKRYDCYSVGENDKYLLVDDGTPEVFKLYVKK